MISQADVKQGLLLSREHLMKGLDGLRSVDPVVSKLDSGDQVIHHLLSIVDITNTVLNIGFNNKILEIASLANTISPVNRLITSSRRFAANAESLGSGLTIVGLDRVVNSLTLLVSSLERLFSSAEKLAQSGAHQELSNIRRSLRAVSEELEASKLRDEIHGRPSPGVGNKVGRPPSGERADGSRPIEGSADLGAERSQVATMVNPPDSDEAVTTNEGATISQDSRHADRSIDEGSAPSNTDEAEMDQIASEIEEKTTLLQSAADDATSSALSSLTESFDGLSKKHSRNAVVYRVGAVLLFIVSIVVTGLLAFDLNWILGDVSDIRVFDWSRKFIVALSFLGFGAYLSRQAGFHQEIAVWASTIEVQLKTLPAYLGPIDDSVLVSEIRRDVARRIFGERSQAKKQEKGQGQMMGKVLDLLKESGTRE